MPATRLSPKRAFRISERTSQPISDEPPIIEAITTIENAASVAWFTPNRICRAALGTLTLKKSCISVAPDMRPDSITSSGTRRKPNNVFRTIGGKA